MGFLSCSLMQYTNKNRLGTPQPHNILTGCSSPTPKPNKSALIPSLFKTVHLSCSSLIGSTLEIHYIVEEGCSCMELHTFDAFLLSFYPLSGNHSKRMRNLLHSLNCMSVFLHCFGIKVGVKIDPKISGYSIAFFQSPSLFTNLEDN